MLWMINQPKEIADAPLDEADVNAAINEAGYEVRS